MPRATARRKRSHKHPGNRQGNRSRVIAATLAVDVAGVSPGWPARAGNIARRAATAAFDAVPASRKPRAGAVELAVLLTSDAAIRTLNATYRKRDEATDVLSFPAWTPGEPAQAGAVIGLGDVVIAYGVTAREAKAEAKTLSAHLTHLVVHGVLHLLGYDHMRSPEAKVMERLETAILDGLGIANPYVATPPRKRRVRR